MISESQKKAVKKYNNSHYKSIAIRVSPSEAEFIDNLAKEKNISKASLIVKSIKYIADNDIDLK